MRKINAVISPIILLLFVIHGVIGAFNLMGITSVRPWKLAWVMVALICVHLVFGVILTVQTLAAQRRAGIAYPKANRLFWARRISGFLIMVLILFHLYAFMGVTAEHYRLPDFNGAMLAAHILLAVTVVFHVITNVRPMLIALGVRRLKPRVGDLAFWMAVLLVLMTAAFVLYYLRWCAV